MKIAIVILLCIISLLVGLFGGYFICDNYSKPDQEVNVDIKLKKNRLIKRIFNKNN